MKKVLKPFIEIQSVQDQRDGYLPNLAVMMRANQNTVRPTPASAGSLDRVLLAVARQGRTAILVEICEELDRADKWPGFNSAHEGYAILREEVDELWDHVKVNQKKRDLDAMRAEAIQVAAMAIKFVNMLDAGRGRV